MENTRTMTTDELETESATLQCWMEELSQDEYEGERGQRWSARQMEIECEMNRRWRSQ